MASSPVDLANSAILKVGGTRINSFDDNKAEAVVVSEYYERSYLYLLSVFYWGFASRTVDLARLPTKPAHEYEYAYALPQDLIRVQRAFPNTNYKIVGRELHTNERSIGIKHTFRAKEEHLPIYFEQTFMYYLAEQITIAITENQKKADSNFVKYEKHLKTAKSLDAQQHPQDGFQDFPLQDERFSGGLGGGGYYR